MKSGGTPGFFLLLALVMFASAVDAQTVRGRIDRSTSYGVYPAIQVPVTLFSMQRGRSAPAYTSREGFYYLYNVPPGQYVLEIWAYNRPVTIPVSVYNQPFNDIPPVTIR